MNWYEYMWIKMSDIPQDIIDQYRLTDKAVNVKVLVEIRKGIYGLLGASQTTNSNSTSKPLGTYHVDTYLDSSRTPA